MVNDFAAVLPVLFKWWLIAAMAVWGPFWGTQPWLQKTNYAFSFGFSNNYILYFLNNRDSLTISALYFLLHLWGRSQA